MGKLLWTSGVVCEFVRHKTPCLEGAGSRRVRFPWVAQLGYTGSFASGWDEVDYVCTRLKYLKKVGGGKKINRCTVKIVWHMHVIRLTVLYRVVWHMHVVGWDCTAGRIYRLILSACVLRTKTEQQLQHLRFGVSGGGGRGEGAL